MSCSRSSRHNWALKPTLAALARKHAGVSERATLDELLGSPTLDASGAERLREVLRATGALEGVLETIAGLLEQSRSALADGVLPSDVRGALDELAEQAAIREV